MAQEPTIQCPKCGNSREDLSKVCRVCHLKSVVKHKRTLGGCIRNRYSLLKSRIKKNEWIEQDFTIDEFIKWSKNDCDFIRIYDNWKSSEYDKWQSPSIDRIDPNKSYALTNIRWTSWRENWQKGNTEQVSDDRPVDFKWGSSALVEHKYCF